MTGQNRHPSSADIGLPTDQARRRAPGRILKTTALATGSTKPSRSPTEHLIWAPSADFEGFDIKTPAGSFETGRYRLYTDQLGANAPFTSARLLLSLADQMITLTIRFEAAGKPGLYRASVVLPKGAESLRLLPSASALEKGRFILNGIWLHPISTAGHYLRLLRDLPETPVGAAKLYAAVGKRALTGGPLSAAAALRELDASQQDPEAKIRVRAKDDPYWHDPGQARKTVHRFGSNLAGRDALLFAAYAPDGQLNDIQRQMVDTYKEAGFHVTVVVNSGAYDPLTDPLCPSADGLMSRENRGFDFGAWADVLGVIGGLSTCRSLTLTNDSIYPLGGADKVRELRSRIIDAPSDIVFCTRSYEVRPHTQSFFVTFKQRAIQHSALDVIRLRPEIKNKDALIHRAELPLEKELSDAGHKVEALYDLETAKRSRKNPTIHHWHELLDAGFPFWKIQLFSSGTLDPALAQDVLGKEETRRLLAHGYEGRGAPTRPSWPSHSAEPSPALGFSRPHNENGVQNAWWPSANDHRTLMVPFEGISREARDVPSILGVIHCYYTDVATEILQQVAALNLPMRLLLTTNTEEKASILRAALVANNLHGAALVTPNRGRDVAPFLVELAKDQGDEDIIFHLHTKKSTYNGRYAGWGSFLRENLLGSRAIVESILACLTTNEIGCVYSEHFAEVAAARNWGYNFTKAKQLLARMGCTITPQTLLEFPTGTMFWAKRDALQPLLDLGLDYDDFDPEAGQLDGTLAHAIERCLLYVCEHQGYRFVRVLSNSADHSYRQGALALKAQDLPFYLQRAARRLLGNDSQSLAFTRAVKEVFPVAVAKATSERPRLNLIVPTLKPEKTFGGVTTALRVFRELINEAGDGVDIRIVVTSDPVGKDSVDHAAKALGQAAILTDPSADILGSLTVIGLDTDRTEPVALRQNDVFLATAWWTADLGYRLLDQQRMMFRNIPEKPLLYLIQDFEPGFYTWSTHYALADATYKRPGDTFALFNSEELSKFMAARYAFPNAQCLPFSLNARIEEALTPRVKEKIILCYGRPSTPRNAHPLIVEALRLWQANHPEEAKSWQIVFAGEDFSETHIKGLENAEIVGKLPLDSYADILSRAAIGVSLMISPHPSYPPLEMAMAGCQVVTNGYEGKNLSLRTDNILSLDCLTAAHLAGALEVAIKKARPGEVAQAPQLAAPEQPYPNFDPKAVLAALGM